MAWAMMGIFPVAGQGVYLITAPFFESVSITNPVSNATAVIRNINFGGGNGTGNGTEGAAGGNIYIQSATLNGEPYTRNWVGHGDLFGDQGGTLELTLGSEESAWGTREEDLPPSVGVGVVGSGSGVGGAEGGMEMGMGMERGLMG